MDDFDLTTRFMELDDKTEELRSWVEAYGEVGREFMDHFEISWIYHDNALDGVVLTYHEIRAAIDRKIVSDVNLIPTYREIKNQTEAIDFVRRSASRRTKLNVEFVKRLHGIICSGIDGVEPGRYRRDIPVHRTYFHEIAEPKRIGPLLSKLMRTAASAGFRRQHPVLQAAQFHHEFMHIFPFPDHSGKVGRLLLNYFLLRGGYLPAVIHAVDRQRYYEALRGTPARLAEFLIEAMDNSLESGVRYLHELAQGPRRAVAR